MYAVRALICRDLPVIVDEHARIRIAAARRDRARDFAAQRVRRRALHAQLYRLHAAVEYAFDPLGVRYDRIEAEARRARRECRLGGGRQPGHARKLRGVDGPCVVGARLVAVAPREREHQRVERRETAIEKRRERRDPVVRERMRGVERVARAGRVQRRAALVEFDRDGVRRCGPRHGRCARLPRAIAARHDQHVAVGRRVGRGHAEPPRRSGARPVAEPRADAFGRFGELVGGRPEGVGKARAHAPPPS
ncbi:hypothetical protein FEP67_02586 [Burkholderia multivorans]|nr:hypothetical protein [Burkholderia multivorans]